MSTSVHEFGVQVGDVHRGAQGSIVVTLVGIGIADVKSGIP